MSFLLHAQEFTKAWHEKEQGVEERITHMEEWVFKRLHFAHEPVWYRENG